MKEKVCAFQRPMAILTLIALVLTLMTGCMDDGESMESPAIQVDGDGNAGSGETWAVYWYICGSDLETEGGYATNDIEEMMETPLPENMTFVLQTGGARNWNNVAVDSSALYRLEYAGEELSVVETVSNASMGDPDTLAGFLEFCETNYPADRKVLIFWDHGGGSGNGICYDELFDYDCLTLQELRGAFGSVYGEPNEAMPFEVVGFDACLMATIDTAAVCSGYASYMVASEENEPGLGWAYDVWPRSIAANPGMDGAQLGRAICDSYYDVCEQWGAEGTITLSTVELSQIDRVVQALDALSLEGIATALDGSPAAFFADYGRGAKRADYYSDGEPEMVDLVSLVLENQHLFPDTADALLESLSNSVTYQRTGSYRANSNGISAYFPYAMDVDQYKNFQSAAAAPAMSYLYEFLFTGALSDEAQEYFTQAGQIEQSLLESDYEFVDTAAYELEDHRVDVIEDDGITYAQMEIGPEAAETLQQVTFMLAAYSDNGEEAVILGEEYDLTCDWENGVFTDNFRGVWGAIDGNVVMMTVSSVTDDYILYDVPILRNGELCSLAVAYLFEDDSYQILTATPDDGGIAPKKQYLLVPGDEITALLYYIDDSNGEGEYYESDTFTVTGETTFHEMELPDGVYGFSYVMTDYQNNSYMSEVIGVMIEDGFPVMLELDS